MNKIQHSHLRISFGPLDYLILSGEMHQIHHSAKTRHRDRNFGAMLSVFDWACGTAYRPEREEIPPGTQREGTWRLEPAQAGRRCLHVEPLPTPEALIRSRDASALSGRTAREP